MSRVAGLLPWRRHSTSLAEVTGGPDLAAKIGYLSSIEIIADLSEQRLQWIKETTTMFTCRRGARDNDPDAE